MTDAIIYIGATILGISFFFIVRGYAKGLKHAPRELFIIFAAKVIEYTAYGAMNLCFTLFLSSDLGLSDVAAGSYVGAFSMSMTLVTMLAGSVADAIGVRATLMLGTVILVESRLVLPLSTNIVVVTAFGFIPMAIGMALKGPVLSVGIKKFTTRHTAALGFGLFYTLMNVGWAAGAWLFDYIRERLGEHGHLDLGLFHLSTYQAIFAVGLVCAVVNLLIIALMRNNVEVDNETGKLVTVSLGSQMTTGTLFYRLWKTFATTTGHTVQVIRTVISEKPFWVFLFLLAILIPVRLVFYHFHYTFPKYAIRVLGEGVRVGALFGVLNPVMIIFLTPLVATWTAKVPSYRVLLVGTLVSSLSVFIAALPPDTFAPLMDTPLAELIFNRWLNMPPSQQQPLVIGITFMVFTFTIGESIWSPRLMQFTAEIAPPGKEGSYIALSYLPYFGAKFIAGPMSGWLVATYTPKSADAYPLQYMVWIWIGATAVLSPIGMLAFRKLYRQKEPVVH